MQDQPSGLCACGCGKPAPISTRNDKARGWVKGEPLTYRKGHHPKRGADLTRYAVDHATGCWAWQGALSQQGYGVARYGGRYAAAHRAVWLASGREIPAGAHLHHICRNRACVNPDHVEVLAAEDHVEEHAREARKLDDDQVRSIRALAQETDLPTDVIARRFGVTAKHVRWLLAGRRGFEPIRRPHPSTRLSDADRDEIKRMVAEGATQRSVARAFGVSPGYVSMLVSGQRGAPKGRTA